jgi:hypothetical protein
MRNLALLDLGLDIISEGVGSIGFLVITLNISGLVSLENGCSSSACSVPFLKKIFTILSSSE